MVLWSVADLYFDVVCFTVLCEVAIWMDVWIIHFTFTSEAGVSIQLVNGVSSRRVELCLSSSPWAACRASILCKVADLSSPWAEHGVIVGRRPSPSLFIIWIVIMFMFLIVCLYMDVVLLWPKTENLFEVGI